MAFPFGGHPTLAQYCTRLQQEFNCAVEQGVATDDNGAGESITKITTEAGLYAIVIGVQHKEHLTPSQVAYLDRRLGINSRFPKLENLAGQ